MKNYNALKANNFELKTCMYQIYSSVFIISLIDMKEENHKVCDNESNSCQTYTLTI
jgi:uncharacterized protein Veg